MTLEISPHKTAVAALTAFVEHERRVNGLQEIFFCPGSDREGSAEDAAAVALAMLQYPEPD